MKEIQAKYKSDPQTQQQKMAQLYSDNNVNPLAGCLPALVQIPVFISLYRALTNLAAQVRPHLTLSSCCRACLDQSNVLVCCVESRICRPVLTYLPTDLRCLIARWLVSVVCCM